MKLLDYLRLALRNLVRQKMRTFLTITAITIGSLSVILMVSLLTGIRQALVDMLDSMDAFNLVTITPDPNSVDQGGSSLITSGNGSESDSSLKLNDTTLSTLKVLPGVADATPIGASLWIDKMYLKGESKKMWASLISYQPDTTVFSMPLKAGRKLTSSDMDKIVVGSRFVKQYNYSSHPEDLIGKKVVFNMKMGGERPDWGELPEKPPMNANKDWWESHNNDTVSVEAEIVGISENGAMDDSQNYINIEWAKRLMTRVRWEQTECKREGPCASTLQLTKSDEFSKRGYGSIILKVKDVNDLKSVADRASKLGYGVSTAQDMLDEINDVIAGVGIVLGAIGGISLFVAAIGIINTMVMATYERTREIGVMRACGATRSTIRRLFTFEAGMLGLWGGVFGLLASILIGKVGTSLATKYASDIPVPLDNIASFPWWLIASVLVFTTLVGTVSGLYPAIRASRLDPVEALRYE